jgi:hypothetical protein
MFSLIHFAPRKVDEAVGRSMARAPCDVWRPSPEMRTLNERKCLYGQAHNQPTQHFRVALRNSTVVVKTYETYLTCLEHANRRLDVSQAVVAFPADSSASCTCLHTIAFSTLATLHFLTISCLPVVQFVQLVRLRGCATIPLAPAGCSTPKTSPICAHPPWVAPPFLPRS